MLGPTVLTGRVVDLRARLWLRTEADPETVPLVHPEHYVCGRVNWPKSPSKKAQALVRYDEPADLLVPAGIYILVKQFLAKMAAVNKRKATASTATDEVSADAVAWARNDA